MEYTISKLAKLSDVSTRTLRYYDELGLLEPKRISSSNYRIYGQNELELLQQILFYRELELPLDEIKEIIQSESFDVEYALNEHLIKLNQKKQRLDRIIKTVEKSIQETKGEITMTDQEKFEAFKKEQITDNEEKYGKEIRKKYGDTAVEQSNEKFKNKTVSQMEKFKNLNDELDSKLAEATKLGDPASELAQEVCALHHKWLVEAWPEGYYDKEMHYNLSVTYVEDQRFKVYFDKIEPGAAEFLNKALKIYTDM